MSFATFSVCILWETKYVTMSTRAETETLNLHSKHNSHQLKVGPGFSGRAGFGIQFVKMFRTDFGPVCNFFSQLQTLLSPVSVEAIELIKSTKSEYL